MYTQEKWREKMLLKEISIKSLRSSKYTHHWWIRKFENNSYFQKGPAFWVVKIWYKYTLGGQKREVPGESRYFKNKCQEGCNPMKKLFNNVLTN